MAQTGFTPIQLYSTSTAAAVPLAGNLTNSTLGSELAINITDGKLFYKDNANAVQVIGWKTVPTTAGGTGLTSYTAGDLVYFASGTTFTKLAIGANTTVLTSSGTAPQWTLQSSLTVGTATNLAGGAAGSVPYQTAASTTAMLAIGASGRYLSSTGTAPQWSAPAALTETDDTNVTLTLGGSPNTALLNAVSMTLGWTGQLAVGRGGTGLSTLTVNRIPYGNNTSAFQSSANLQFNGTVLAVGGTLSAWDSTQGVVQTLGSSLWGTAGVGHVSTNTFFDGTNYKYLTTNFVEDYYQLNGAHVFRSAASGTAGNNVTFTNLINVDIGKTLALQGGTQSNGCGIAFPGTQSASTDANTLDDYREGTFTPTLLSTSGTITTVGTTVGRFTKIGNQVTVVLYLPITTNGTGAGLLRVSNMPYTCNAAASSFGAGREQLVTGNGTFGYIDANTTNLYIQRYDGAYPGGTGFGNGFTITYFV